MQFTEYTINKLKPLCEWPSAGDNTKEAMQDLWLTVMRYDAPYAEIGLWQDYFLKDGSPFAVAEGKTVLEAMIYSMLMNPYFILEH